MSQESKPYGTLPPPPPPPPSPPPALPSSPSSADAQHCHTVLVSMAAESAEDSEENLEIAIRNKLDQHIISHEPTEEVCPCSGGIYCSNPYHKTTFFFGFHIPHYKVHHGISGEGSRSNPSVSFIRIDYYAIEPLWSGETFIPDGVISCEPCLVSCTVSNSEFTIGDLVRQLFEAGHVVSQFEPFHVKNRMRSLLPIREIRVERLSTPKPLEQCSRAGETPRPRFQSVSRSPISNLTSPVSFKTASSQASFISPRSSYGNSAFFSANGYSPVTMFGTIREDEPPEPGLSAPLTRLHNDYYKTLHQQEIIQPFDKELNWSGKGQHVTYSAHETIPLSSISHLGSSMSATVDKVVCRRIALARKTMRCSQKWSVVDTLREVYHLQNLRHFHIIQLVGTYLQGRNFSILMYPAADMHLGRFMEDTLDMDIDISSSFDRRLFLASTLGCLTSAVAFIHQQTTKHMDIKPQNILIREVCSSGTLNPDWRVYIADFGLSRSFASQDHSQTDGPTSRTPKYCAPEVYNFEERGRSSDVFSLGCVFLEVLTVICGIDLHRFSTARRGDGNDESFHANLERVVEWADSHLRESRDILEDIYFGAVVKLVTSMVNHEPSTRPTAVQIYDRLRSIRSGRSCFHRKCCHLPPESYEAYA